MSHMHTLLGTVRSGSDTEQTKAAQELIHTL